MQLQFEVLLGSVARKFSALNRKLLDKTLKSPCCTPEESGAFEAYILKQFTKDDEKMMKIARFSNIFGRKNLSRNEPKWKTISLMGVFE